MSLPIALISALALFHTFSVPKFLQAHKDDQTAAWWIYVFAGIEVAITTTGIAIALLMHTASYPTILLLIPIILTTSYALVCQDRRLYLIGFGRILATLIGLIAISMGTTCENCVTVGYLAAAALTTLTIGSTIHLNRYDFAPETKNASEKKRIH